MGEVPKKPDTQVTPMEAQNMEMARKKPGKKPGAADPGVDVAAAAAAVSKPSDVGG
ncbi:hypothetical protein [Mangrovicella endophytica]|uniref:hypothetical protein n=1 Tax=Mangrovicella endophytica TaxID=2066697 RepID=UPI0012FFD448|nr:hypothetical protein [Mangrovicella endophytica]